ncbi:ArsR family transcriptional regulator [Loktanella sp. 3ANDIMAR09]|uniref:arsenate reductase/protein-tyrosine-phosphatase family protein n=1 Tax=Loktanella sp. 3ANDIMAR09 TaxID=1225657 RepID=UPI0006F9EE92|nr:helix-turn-helix domain-containing protein [Loktanella sp. 3ANDIMAR09]KQI67462.1 ArsR family transcriptional regulator [Loktanella sp. 3ANDIMAR09]
MESMIAHRLSILGHPQRLALFRLLMRRYPDHVPASELARALGLKPNTLSVYIGALMQAGLVDQERAGTSLRYAIRLDSTRETFDYLLHDCCRGRPDICTPLSMDGPTADTAGRKFKVLFLCTGNSARSIMAETILRAQAGDRFDVWSAGTRPRSAINPDAFALLRQKGHDTASLEAKSMTVFQTPDAPDFDFVFTVCDQAANEDCPAWQGQPISGHWGLPDPAAVTGTDAERALAFHQTYGALLHRIRAFAALPVASLDRIALQRAVDDIAAQKGFVA